MGFFKDIRNEHLICELENSIGKSMVLFTVDGFAYYGKLDRVIGHRVGVLVAGAGQQNVIVRLPDQTFVPQGTGAIQEVFTLIDLYTVVAKTVGLSELPPGFVWVMPA